MKYRKASHATYDCRYHIVWITKYRRKVLSPALQEKIIKIIEWVCKETYVKILAIWMEEDHVHMYVSIPLVNPIPYIVQILKGRTSKVIWDQYESYLKKYYWNKHSLWAVGYFVCTVWEVNHDIIKKYVDEQWKEDVEGEEIEF